MIRDYLICVYKHVREGPFWSLILSHRTNLEHVWQRELGDLSTLSFAHRLGVSKDLVLRLELYKKLDNHEGCVNTISFNVDGDILVSGSNDKRVILWEWQTGNVKISFYTGHTSNVFQAKIVPGSDDRSIVTYAADGQVRHAQILERGQVETRLLGKHRARAHKLAIEPGRKLDKKFLFYSKSKRIPTKVVWPLKVFRNHRRLANIFKNLLSINSAL